MNLPKSNLLVLCLALACGSAMAQTKDGGAVLVSNAPEGTCAPITDNGYVSPAAGTTGMTCRTVTLPAGTVNNATIQLGLTHTWVGDLTVKVVPPSGTPIVTLFNRPGAPLAAAGDSSNLINTSPLSFADAFTDDPETMGNTIATGGVICSGDGRCNYRVNRDAETGSATNLAALNGQAAAGNWQVCVGDSAALDTGDLCAVTITPGGGGGGGGVTYTALPATLAFGNQTQGVASASQTMTMTNTTAAGGGNLSVTSCTFGGTNPGDFSFAAPAPTFPIAIAAQANSPIRVVFTPAAVGARSATMTCATNTTPASVAIALSGTGVTGTPLTVTAPTSSAAAPIVVGTTTAGTQIGPRNVAITAPATNTGPVTIASCTAITSTPANLFNYGTPAPTFPISIAPGGTANIPVFYNPPVGAPAGAYAGNFTCTTGAGVTPATFEVFVSGTVSAALITQIPSLSDLGKWLMIASLLGFGLVVLGRRQS